MAFDQSTRNRLQKFVSDARSLLSEEFTRQLQNDYGLDPLTGTVSPLENLAHLDDTRLETARILRETLAHYLPSSPSGGAREALERIIREQAFTVLNRLSALRMTESRGILIESVGNGYQSKGFQLYERLAGSGLGEMGDTYRCYLFSIFDEFALDLKVLFDRFSPQGRLFPRETALLDLLKLLNDPELAYLWAEDETIGWVYQYFNSKEERKKMRDESAAPRNSRELAVRNQFFTPRYVVEFLTDNTLGRIWYEMTQGKTGLKEFCRYLVRRPTEIFLKTGEVAPVQTAGDENLSQEDLLRQPVYILHRPLKDPRIIRMLDPACGSMHFGLYSFDLYERIYEEAWELELRLGSDAFVREAGMKPLTETYPDKDTFMRDVPRLIIEHNIHGIDIDPRAVQIAGLSLWLRAQRSWHNLGVKPADRPRITRSNIVCAEPMPGEDDMRREFTAGLKPRVLGQIVDEVFEKMKLAGEAGSLLKIEEEIKDAIDEAKKQWGEQPRPVQMELFVGSVPAKPDQMELRFDVKGITDERFWDQAEDCILDALKNYAEQSENGRAMRRRLFVEDAARGFAFIDLCRKRYDVVLMNPPFGEPCQLAKQWISSAFPTTKNDILGPFLERAIKSLHSGGAVGAITARTAFQLSSMAGFRKDLILKETTIRTFADFGGEVLDSAMVKTAAYALIKAREDMHSVFINLTDTFNKGERLALEIANGLSSKNVFWIKQQEFMHIPGAPFAYWADNVVRQCFQKLPSLASLNAEVKQGLGTTDDFRFVRAVWEVSSISIGIGKNWYFYAKGGESNDFYSDIHLVVNWAEGGREIYEYNGIPYGGAGAPIRNPAFYFKPGLTYTSYTNKGFSPRVLPSGCIFTTAGMGIFVNDPLPLLSLLNSRVIQLFLLTITDERKWEVGYVSSIPIKKLDSVESNWLSELAILGWREAITSTLWCENQRLYYGLVGASQIPTLRSETERRNNDSRSSGNKLRQLRHEIDERVAKLYGLSNHHIEFVDTRLGITTEENPPVGDTTTDFISFFVGIIFGRWDVRIALDSTLAPKLPDPFDPLPFCSPGMLVGPDGMPAEPNNIVSEEWLRARPDASTLPPPGMVKNPIIPDSEYPLHINWSGILVDDEDHPEDIISRIREVIEVIWKEKAGDIEHEACEILGVRSLRDYFVKPSGFFADHLKRYSKSRRQAPIYWALSTPSGSYTLWIYYHRLNDQTLYTCINDFVEPKLRDIANELSRLHQKAGSRSRTDEKELESLQDFEMELQAFRDELLRIARLPWKPNLNDGVQITAAPLWKLFQMPKWKKTLKETWEKLEKGDYDWAHLAYSIWPDRVREKCRKDKSLAIAHNLEELYEEPPASAKKKRGKKKGAVEDQE
jgi:predicted RNA methylase